MHPALVSTVSIYIWESRRFAPRANKQPKNSGTHMKKIHAVLALAGCVAALGLSSGKVAAQGRGNFDPAQMREDYITRVTDAMDIKDDAEKKAISDAVGKVFDARREVGFGGGMRFGGRRNRGGGGGNSTDT